MPCGCCQGACCFCVRGFHYYVDATEPTGGTAYQDRTLGALTPPYPEGSWDCQDLYAVDGEDVWVPGNTGGPAGGTFVTKFCHTGGFACRFADWIWDNAEDAGASAPYSAWTREDQLTACVQTSRDECEQCRETVDDLELLQDKCGFFSPGLACAGGPPVPWPAGSETCGCCMQLIAVPQIVAALAIDWYGQNPGFDPFESRWNDMKDALEAAGWTVTINVVPYTENGDDWVAVSMDITSDCCFDCSAIIAARDEAAANNGAITGQPAGLWVNVNGELPIDYNSSGNGIGFGHFYITGCCGQLAYPAFQSPVSVNGVGGGTDTWIPSPNAYCNPLP